MSPSDSSTASLNVPGEGEKIAGAGSGVDRARDVAVCRNPYSFYSFLEELLFFWALEASRMLLGSLIMAEMGLLMEIIVQL